MMREYIAKEEGFIFAYVSNESPTLVDVYFDDVVMTHTKGNVVQYNEYYPFGMQTANSWTRENVTGNNFLANGGTELNTTSNLYDLDFRNYDPALGRMYGVDPMASKYSSLTPYNYSFNNPVMFNDVNGADPYTINYSASTSQYYTMYTYDDRIDPTGLQQAICGQCWREGNAGAMEFYGAATGYGSSMFGLGTGWKPGDSRIHWSPFEAAYRQLVTDAANVKSGNMSLDSYANRWGTSITTDQLRTITSLLDQGYNAITGHYTNQGQGQGEASWWGEGEYTSSTTGKTYGTSKGRNALRILGSFFVTDPRKTKAGNALQMASRLTWQLPQQLLGVLYVETANLVGMVESVSSLKGALLVRTKRGGGLTLGNIITSSSAFIDSHEWGHTVQSSILGPLYLPLIGIPSFIRASGIQTIQFFGGLKYFTEDDYYRFYTESSANWLRDRFFNR
ncbi:MAG: hypothetical protein KF763_10045 [Cyclobacteriaceae bacterium]|nr:hypothetical protein [Cyclobacteriaceae bacterium]